MTWFENKCVLLLAAESRRKTNAPNWRQHQKVENRCSRQPKMSKFKKAIDIQGQIRTSYMEESIIT
jgi:hypothetical protein